MSDELEPYRPQFPLVLGESKHWERYEGDSLAYDSHPLLNQCAVEVGQVHQSGYAPKWTYNFAKYRGMNNFRGPMDSGQTFDTAEDARQAAERALDAHIRANGT